MGLKSENQVKSEGKNRHHFGEKPIIKRTRQKTTMTQLMGAGKRAGLVKSFLADYMSRKKKKNGKIGEGNLGPALRDKKEGGPRSTFA